MSDLDRLKEIYLDDVDEETRAENEQRIIEWERSLRANRSLAKWQGHEITREMATEAKRKFTEASLTLAQRRNLTEAERYILWAQQDAARWILSITETDAAKTVKEIEQQVRLALASAT